ASGAVAAAGGLPRRHAAPVTCADREEEASATEARPSLTLLAFVPIEWTRKGGSEPDWHARFAPPGGKDLTAGEGRRSLGSGEVGSLDGCRSSGCRTTLRRARESRVPSRRFSCRLPLAGDTRGRRSAPRWVEV